MKKLLKLIGFYIIALIFVFTAVFLTDLLTLEKGESVHIIIERIQK